MRVAMIGTGYVGLVSGACFADFGHHVVCVDKDTGKIAALHRGEMPIYEPGLDDLVAANVKAGRLSFATDLKGPVAAADAVFIAVGTPSRRGDGHADLTYVYAAAEEIAAALGGYTVIVTKSTVPVGTSREDEANGRRARPEAKFDMDSNPEFLREAPALEDLRPPDRVFGGFAGRTVAIVGLTFKPNTDDMREAPSLVIVPDLQARGAHVKAFDPQGAREAARHFNVELCKDAYDAISGADGVVILTE